MSLLIKALKQLNPDEDNLNSLVNKSFLGSFCNSVMKFISSVTNGYTQNSLIIQNLNVFYWIILTILIFAIPFVQTGTLGMLACMLICITFINFFFTHKKFEFSALHIPVFIYLAILIISVCFSALLMPSLKGLAKMLIYIGLFFSFFEFFKKEPKRIVYVIVLLALSLCIELLFGLKQIIFGVNELAGWQDKTFMNPEDVMSRVFRTLKPNNPNLFAAYLLSTTPVMVGVSLYKFLKREFKPALIVGLISLISMFTLVQTGCRGGYIALFFSAIFFISLFAKTFKNYLTKNAKIKKLIFIIVGVVCIIGVLGILFSPAISHRLESIFTLRGDSSNSYRMNVYMSSLKMFVDNFWIGIGVGNTTYRLIYGLYMVTGFDALGAYNIFLEMAVESGIFALLSFLWLIFLTFAKAIKKLTELSIEYKVVTIICLSSVFAMMIHGFVDTIWYRPQIQILFWLYISILAVITMKGFADEK